MREVTSPHHTSSKERQSHGQALVRWATGNRLTNRQHKLSPITPPSPLWNGGIFRSRPDIRVDVSPLAVPISGGSGRVSSCKTLDIIYDFCFSSTSVIMVDVRFELPTSSASHFDGGINPVSLPSPSSSLRLIVRCMHCISFPTAS